MEALKEKLAEYIKGLDINQIIALIVSLIAKKQDGVFSAAADDAVLREVEQLSPEDQQKLLASLQS